MNASDQSRNLHDTLEAMLDELGKVAQNETTSPDELYEQSADILRLLFQPDSVAIFLFGINGLVVNAASSSFETEKPIELEPARFEKALENHGEASVVKDESNRSHISFGLGSAADLSLIHI